MTGKSEVLVVDDDADNARFVAEIVEDVGYTAAVVADAYAAMRLVGERRFDLVITDIRMPGMDGVELIQRVRSTEEPWPAIIAITAFGSHEMGMRALRAGAVDYLSKPFEPAELRARMRYALEKRAQGRG